MKKNFFLGKNLLILLTGSLIATSCMTDAESPVIQDDQVEIALEETGETGDENLRKGGFMPYEDTFQNQIIALDENFEIVEKPLETPWLIKYLPGFGEGKAKGLGRSYSLINQIVTGPVTTEGQPVVDYLPFVDFLISLGIDPNEIPIGVSTIVINERGHALFMTSGTNTASPFDPLNPIRTFSADVTIVGGTKIYKDATGSGTVTGWYNGITGEGESTVNAEIKLK